MSTPEWQPANEVELQLATALATEDSSAYAQAVLAAPLYLPVPPGADTAGWPELLRELDLDFPHVLAFTSLAGMGTVLGKYVEEYHEGDFPTLARFWPDPTVPLALNPGLPISAVVPLNVLTALADGNESLVSAGEVADAMAEESQARIRQACLAELGAVASPAGPEPAGELEIALATAARQGDINEFVATLLESEVVVPTATTVVDPDLIVEPDFPWRTVSVGGLPVTTVFSSAAMLDRVGPVTQPRVQVPFISVIAAWPGEEHLLCLNPGSRTEMFLSGEAIAELFGALQVTPD